MFSKNLIVAAALSLSLPAVVAAQDFALAGRAGTIGLGAEAAVGFGNRLTLRGGLGLTPIDIDAGSLVEAGDQVEATLTLPKTWFNLGADLSLGGGFRVGGGMLFKTDDPSLDAMLSATGTIEIDGEEYSGTQVASLTGVLDSKDQAPYAIIGFGSPQAQGIGLFLDLGVAFLGDPEVALSATGDPTVVESNEFQSRLRQEEQRIEDEAGDYLRLWPIINLGVRIGF